MNKVMLQLWSKYLVCRPHRSHSPFLTCLFEALCACFINAKLRRNAFIFEICCVVMSSCAFTYVFYNTKCWFYAGVASDAGQR
jgi:hypothetical protein